MILLVDAFFFGTNDLGPVNLETGFQAAVTTGLPTSWNYYIDVNSNLINNLGSSHLDVFSFAHTLFHEAIHVRLLMAFRETKKYIDDQELDGNDGTAVFNHIKDRFGEQTAKALTYKTFGILPMGPGYTMPV